MTAIKVGGPAFPTDCEDGMTLRDYFAAAAMQGTFASMSDDPILPREVARDAYVMAAAMLKAREVQP